jgi:hypothetical protein
MTKKVKVLPVGTPTASGRLYSTEVVQEAMDGVEANDGRMLVTLGQGMKMSDVCGQVVEMELRDDGLYVEVEILDTEAGKLVQQAISMGGPGPYRSNPRVPMSFSVSGRAKVAGDGTVEEMAMLGIDASFENKG